MKMTYFLGLLPLFSAACVWAENANFDDSKAGELPSGWIAGCTGSGTPKWTVETDATAPSKKNVLKQSGEGSFPWCVKKDIAIANGAVEVKFKPVDGKEDQAGGVIWRFKDSNNYYVARANALEDNISIYYTEAGTRKTIQYVDAKVNKNDWNTLRVEFKDADFTVSLNGKQYLAVHDTHILGVGSVGVWTKSDSVTLFDDFHWSESK